MRRLVTAALALVLMAPAFARGQGGEPESREAWLATYRRFGAAATVSWPYTEFGDKYDSGWGLHALVDQPFVPLINLTADVGWNTFPGGGERDRTDVWNVTVGGKLTLGVFYMGGETGYLSSVDRWGWVPSLGARFGDLEVALRLTTAGSQGWTTLRLGYYLF
jgi:hypothetical protein